MSPDKFINYREDDDEEGDQIQSMDLDNQHEYRRVISKLTTPVNENPHEYLKELKNS